MTGAGTVAVANKKVVSEYSKSLQAAGLTVSMAPDGKYDGAVYKYSYFFLSLC